MSILTKIAEEHADIFPKATLETQIEKLAEEFEEKENAEDEEQMLNEQADCFICLAGIYRFSPKVEKALAKILPNVITMGSDTMRKALKKWEINKQRKWHFDEKTGKYKHIGTDGNE
jgi:hypothetical protein